MFNNHTYTAEDCGGAIKGNHIDLYFDKNSDAVKWGVKYMDVYWANESVTTSVKATGNGNIPASIYYTACQKYLGIPYVWGGMSSSGYDCSGFVWSMMKDLGYSWGRTTAREQSKYGKAVPVTGSMGLGSAQPGDVLFNHNGSYINHVMIYLGNGYLVHAPKPGDVIKTQKVWKTPYCIRRLF